MNKRNAIKIHTCRRNAVRHVMEGKEKKKKSEIFHF